MIKHVSIVSLEHEVLKLIRKKYTFQFEDRIDENTIGRVNIQIGEVLNGIRRSSRL